jgi:acyl-CoA dehydrogenase
MTRIFALQRHGREFDPGSKAGDRSADLAPANSGSLGTAESSMTKVAVSEALFRVADRCVQAMGGTGVSGDTIV